ncbi:hypothetical protein OG851_42505 (plasmid) [Streptomyces sp. NBC_00161]|uniref:hypothetical protein n=1 Tax=Streptomyces sp. NBC_00161 TaxID=2975671 RepID=UPI002F911A9A
MTAVKPTVEAVLAAIPTLAPYARKAVLLRPRAGEPSPDASHIGGPMLWPGDEEWPRCQGPHMVEVREKLSRADRETLQRIDRDWRARRAGKIHDAYDAIREEAEIRSRIMDGADVLDKVTWERIRRVPVSSVPGVPLIGVLQLLKQDVPVAGWPGAMDVLQVLWCPQEHAELPGQAHYWGPAVEVHYRSAASLAAAQDVPVPVNAVASYVPRPCLLDPVEVTELPAQDELPADLFGEAEAWAEQHGIKYHRTLACLEGWKAGGWPSWHLTDLVPIDCACGATTRLFLTADSGRDPDLNVGRFGELRIFACPVDASHPLRLNIQ